MSIEVTKKCKKLDGISRLAKIVAVAMSSYAHYETNTCFPSIRRLASDTAYSIRTVQLAIKELVELNIVEKKERFSEEKTVVKQVIYIYSHSIF